MSEQYIKFENVTKSYGSGAAQINALSDASFEINKGEFCILLGSSGAGKTKSSVRKPPQRPRKSSVVSCMCMKSLDTRHMRKHPISTKESTRS